VAQCNHWKHNNAAQQQQNADVQKFKRQALASLPKFVISFLRSPVYGTLRLSLRDIYQGMLGKLGTLSFADLDKNASQLTSSYTAGTAITDHIALHRQSHTVAQLNKQPFPEASKVKSFADSLSSCPQFQSRLDAWFIQYPAVANQTFDSLATAIELHSSSRHFHSTNSCSMGYAASILPAPPAPDIAAIVAAVQAAMKTARPAGSTSRTTSSGYRRSAARDYCWTHGQCGHSNLVIMTWPPPPTAWEVLDGVGLKVVMIFLLFLLPQRLHFHVLLRSQPPIPCLALQTPTQAAAVTT
jgi:hypothetical protein